MERESVDYTESELLYNRFMEPALQSAITALALPPGSVGLDAGCGPGGVLHLLDTATRGVGRIVGLDLSEAHLKCAQEQIEQRGLQARVSLAQADLSQPLPFSDDVFDWVWTADVLCSGGEFRGFAHPADVVSEFVRVVKPGGTIAVFLGNRLGAMFMPGYAAIEQRLTTAADLYYRKRQHYRPSFHNEKVLSWLRDAGLTHLKLSAHITEYQSPLSPEVARYIQKFVFEEEYASDLKPHAMGMGMTEEDWQTWLELADPQSPHYLLNSEDYYCVRFGVLATGRSLK
jgi:ubiquinone/menaquinone biosynthesis C-methylase UbiE